MNILLLTTIIIIVTLGFLTIGFTKLWVGVSNNPDEF